MFARSERDKKERVPDKFNAEDPSPRGWLAKVAMILFVVIAIVVLVYGIFIKDGEIVKKVFDTVKDIVILILVFYFGRASVQR